MKNNQELIPAEEFCTTCEIELSFISSLQDHGLLAIETIEQRTFIPAHQLAQLEKFIRLHYDLDINIAGIEAISHLLERIESLQNELKMLRNRLH
jgi:chaperone modulatory protein CbpM